MGRSFSRSPRAKSRSRKSRRSRSIVTRSSIEKGALTRYGYHLSDPSEKRHKALRKACREEKCKRSSGRSSRRRSKCSGVHRVIKQVNLLTVWNKSRPALLKKAKKDLAYVRGILEKSKSRSRSRSRSKSRTSKRGSRSRPSHRSRSRRH